MNKIAIVGLGYVGLPLFVEATKKYNVVGYDVNKRRVQQLKKNFDITNEVSSNNLLKIKKSNISHDLNILKDSDIFVVTVPTPIHKNNLPDLSMLQSASANIAKFLKKKNLVIYESTVYPYCIREICIPILENLSNLSLNKDFLCGYSPERINPGDKVHSFINTNKIVSGSNEDALKKTYSFYKKMIKAKIHKAKSIEIAEASKVIENIQRDVNIALVNELSTIFDKIKIPIKDVLQAASTKWNFLNFKPGLVGGHCVGVDPYYLMHKVKQEGLIANLITVGRNVNDKMVNFVIKKIQNLKNKKKIKYKKLNIIIFGLTFKENTPDFRNSKNLELANILANKNNVYVYDPYLNDDIKTNCRVLKNLNNNINFDAFIFAVNHKKFKSIYLEKFLKKKYTKKKIIINLCGFKLKNIIFDYELN